MRKTREGEGEKAINGAKVLINSRSVNDDVRNWFTPLSNYPAEPFFFYLFFFIFWKGNRGPDTHSRRLTIERLFLPPHRPPNHAIHSAPTVGLFTSFAFARSNRRKNMFSRGRLFRSGHSTSPASALNTLFFLLILATLFSANGPH